MRLQFVDIVNVNRINNLWFGARYQFQITIEVNQLTLLLLTVFFLSFRPHASAMAFLCIYDRTRLVDGRDGWCVCGIFFFLYLCVYSTVPTVSTVTSLI